MHFGNDGEMIALLDTYCECHTILEDNEGDHVSNATHVFSFGIFNSELLYIVCSGSINFEDFLRALRLKPCSLSEKVCIHASKNST